MSFSITPGRWGGVARVGLQCRTRVRTLGSVSVPDYELVAIERSAAMAQPRTSVPVEREVLMAIVREVTEQRRLMRRLGAELKTVARNAPPP